MQPEEGTMTWRSDEDMKRLLDQGLQDLLPLVEPMELVASFRAPCRVLVECLLDLPEEDGPPAWRGAGADALPAIVWKHVRETYPDAAVFPLGTVAQRALERTLWALAREGWASRIEEPSLDQLRTHLATTRTQDRLDLAIAREFLGYWLFEAAMLDLRGVTHRPELDYDSGYHWSGPLHDLRWRDTGNEAALRRRLLDECRGQASLLLAAWSRAETRTVTRPDGSRERCWDFEKAFKEIFDVRFRSGDRREDKWPLDRRPFRVLGRRPPKRLADTPTVIAPDARLICVRGRCANVDTGLREIEQHLTRSGIDRVDGLVADLVEIAATAYFADIFVPRDSVLSRDLTFLLPVRYPDRWNRHAELLARCISYLTQNFVAFCFTGLGGVRGEPRKPELRDDGAETVCLFSGGLDSFIGAADLLHERAVRPVLLSHYANPALERFQDRLLQHLRTIRSTRFGETFESLRIPVRTRRNAPARWRLGTPPPQTLYQHGRSFLFLSLAAAVALERGIGTIDVCENGPIALNPAFSESRFNTRSAHPDFLASFRDLIRAVFGVDLAIRNRYADRTKGQMLAGLLERHPDWAEEDSPVLATTNSCWAYSRVRALAARLGVKGFRGGHCGRCLPCIWRQAAFHRAGARLVDDTYLADVIPEDARTRLLDLPHLDAIFDQLRLCQNAVELSDARFLDLCPDLLARSPETTGARLDLYRHFSNEMLACFSEQGLRLGQAA